MTLVFLGLGTNVDRERSMRVGLEALKRLDAGLTISNMYESAAIGFDGAHFYNCVVQLDTELTLVALVAELKAIESVSGRDHSNSSCDGKGLDIDVLTYGDWVGCYDGVVLPRPDVTCYAHVLLPLSEIAPQACLPGTQRSYRALWKDFKQPDQRLAVVAF